MILKTSDRHLYQNLNIKKQNLEMKIKVQYQLDLEKLVADLFSKLAPLLSIFFVANSRLIHKNGTFLRNKRRAKTVGVKSNLVTEIAETLPDNVRFCRNPNCKAILPSESLRKDCNDRCKSAYHNYIRAKADFCG
jgi:hypothetical protein